MKSKVLFIISVLMLGIGIVLFAYQHEWILLQIPYLNTRSYQANNGIISKQKVTFFFWHHEKWQHEVKELLISESKTKTLHYLITQWIELIHEYKQEKKVAVQTTMLSPSGQDLYTSFDRNPFPKHYTIYEKLMWLEGLMKTIRMFDASINNIQLLVNHTPSWDYHLDFLNPWPIKGFFNNQ